MTNNTQDIIGTILMITMIPFAIPVFIIIKILETGIAG